MESFKIENLTFIYPEQIEKALDSVTLTINQGEFVTICGKSGCGKSTLLRQLKPILSPHGTKSGKIFFEGRDISELDKKEQCEKIGFVLQSPDSQIVTDKVWHELAFGLESLSYSTEEIRARVAEMASFFGIQAWFHKSTDELSGGQKQLLNLASVMVMQPSVLILDEPTSQLDPIAAQEFIGILAKINRELGTTVILTEHRLEEVFSVSDRVVVMENGRIFADGNVREAGKKLKEAENDMYMALPAPMRIYFSAENGENCPVNVREGKDWLESVSKTKEFKGDLPCEANKDVSGENAVVLDEVWFRYEKESPDIVKGVSLSVKKGEFYAIVGGNGTGKTTALSVIGKMRMPYRGSADAEGRISMLPQNPQVLFVKKEVKLDLMEMLDESKLSREEKEKRISNVAKVCGIEKLLDKHPYDLSGGEQQRAALAKVLLSEPDILLLDEPTKGMDAYFKEKLAQVLEEFKKNGKTVIMVSHDIEFCAKYADRCGLFFDGGLVSEGKPREFFSGKNFYTTVANRMAREVIPEAVLAEDIIYALDGKQFEKRTESESVTLECSKKEAVEEKKEEKKSVYKKLSVKNIIFGSVFLVAFVVLHILFNGKFTDYRSAVYQIVSILVAGLAVYNFIPKKQESKDNNRKLSSERKSFTKRTLLAMLMILVVIPATIYIGYSYLDDRKYYFISLLIILETMLPFFVLFEKRKPEARELIVISVLCAIAVVGRGAFYMLPQFKPITALVIIGGVCFGGEAGFLIGAVSGFVSNFFFGQGPWTPWQMFAFGIVGFLAGVLFRKGFLSKTKTALCIYGAIASLVIFGGIINPSSVILWQDNPTKEMFISAYISGFPFDLVHSAATVFFLWFIAEPMIEKLERIKTKYGLIER